MNKNYRLLFIAFLFYLIGHILWTYTIIFEKTLINESIEIWIVNIPFFIFGLIGLIATFCLHNKI